MLSLGWVEVVEVEAEVAEVEVVEVEAEVEEVEVVSPGQYNTRVVRC